MSRVSIHLDETKPLEPVAILTINGQSTSLSEREFQNLYAEMWWATDHIKRSKQTQSVLAGKYKEVAES